MGLYLSEDNAVAKKVKAAVKETQNEKEVQDLRDHIYQLEAEIEAVVKVFSEEIEALKKKGSK